MDDDGQAGIGGSKKPEESVDYASDVPATIKVFADGLIPFFEGDLTIAKMFNRRWQNREEGVSQFVQ